MRAANITHAMKIPEIAAALGTHREVLRQHKIYEYFKFFLAMCAVNILIAIAGYHSEDPLKNIQNKINREMKWAMNAMLGLMAICGAAYMFPSLASKHLMFFPTQNSDDGSYRVICEIIKNNSGDYKEITALLESLKNARTPQTQDSLMQTLIKKYDYYKLISIALDDTLKQALAGVRPQTST